MHGGFCVDLSMKDISLVPENTYGHNSAVHKLTEDHNELNALTLNLCFRFLQVKNGTRKIPLYSIDSNPRNSNEFLVSGKDHFVR